MKLPLTIISFLCFTLCTSRSFCQGKIEQSKKELNKGNPDNTQQSPQQPSHPSSEKDKTVKESFFEGVGKIFLYITYYSTVGSYKAEAHLHSRVTSYPYYNKRSGNYEKADTTAHRKNHFHADLDYHLLYSNKDLTGHNVKVNLRPFQYFYLQAQYHHLKEYVNNRHDRLSLFNFNFCYDRLRFEKFNLGWKLGMCYIADNVNRGGFSGGVEAEAFIVRPVSIYASKQWGAINRVQVNEFEIGAKLHINRFNIHAGYEHLKIGSPLYDYAFAGVGIRL